MRKRRRRNGTAPPSPLERAQQAALRLIEDARLNLSPPVPRPQTAAPPSLVLGPPIAGDAARLAAALLLLRHAVEQARAVDDRCLVREAALRTERGGLDAQDTRAQLAEERKAAAALVSIAHARVVSTRTAIREHRIRAGLFSSSGNADFERAWRRLFPEDAPAIPWGYRPAPGERVLATPITDSPHPQPITTADLLDKILSRGDP